jgi:mannan endo-1,4-beta-mannosidase
MLAAARRAHTHLAGGLEVQGNRLRKDGRPFFASGFNYWGASTLAREGNILGWDQVRRALDRLQSLGINMIRTMGATEGPDTEPLRIVPSIQPARGRYEAAGVAGVLRLAEELQRRGLYVILMLNNFWPWSGGMAQYVAWAGGRPIPYPLPGRGTFFEFIDYAGEFYRTESAKEAFRDYVRFLVPQLSGNPAIVWELANEPRGMSNAIAYRAWIDDTARLIKSLAPDQLVTTGSEGETPAPELNGLDVVKDHMSPSIDLITFHLWAQNWGWMRPNAIAQNYPDTLDRARRYVTRHVDLAIKVGKPILLEEFGFPRDGGSFDPNAPTAWRDRYFNDIYGLVYSLLPDTPLAGVMPWAWSGDSRPARPGNYWNAGDPITGDPPHEQQGWYSVYQEDSTLGIIRAWSSRIAAVRTAS